MIKRSLYQCLNAKVNGTNIYCSKGHVLSNPSKTINIRELIRGSPLELHICQQCPDYDEMGKPIPRNERGWQ